MAAIASARDHLSKGSRWLLLSALPPVASACGLNEGSSCIGYVAANPVASARELN